MKNILNTLKGPSIFFVSYKFTLWHQAGQESLRTQCLPSHPPSLQIDSLLMARVFIIPPKLICETQIRVSNERDLLLTELIVPITSYYSHKTKQKLDITHHTSHSPLTCLCRQWLPLTGSTLPFPKVTQVNILIYLNSRAQYFIHFSSEGTCNMW